MIVQLLPIITPLKLDQFKCSLPKNVTTFHGQKESFIFVSLPMKGVFWNFKSRWATLSDIDCRLFFNLFHVMSTNIDHPYEWHSWLSVSINHVLLLVVNLLKNCLKMWLSRRAATSWWNVRAVKIFIIKNVTIHQFPMRKRAILGLFGTATNAPTSMKKMQ